MDFPKTNPPENEEVREALKGQVEARIDANTNKNLTRREETYNIGDTVVTRNHNKTKFQPTFGPNPMTITEIGEGGVVCNDESSTTQRRHLDDVKPAPAMAPHNTYTHIHNTPTQSTIHHEELSTIPSQHGEESGTHNIDFDAPRRSKRNRNPNPRFEDYVLH